MVTVYGSHMEKTTVYLDASSYQRLKQIAQREGRKPAELVREAVTEYAARHSEGRRVPASLAAFASGKGDLAARDEAYLEGFGERDRR